MVYCTPFFYVPSYSSEKRRELGAWSLEPTALGSCS
jgi:hypothetical protein